MSPDRPAPMKSWRMVINQQIDLISQPDIADFEIGAATALTREHLLASGGKTCVITNALERLQDVLALSYGVPPLLQLASALY